MYNYSVDKRLIGHRNSGATRPRPIAPWRLPLASHCTPQVASSSNNRSFFQTEEGSWIIHSKSKPPKGVVHFIGGAFAGAAPQLIYSLFIDLLAQEGYSIIATPYAISFDHKQLAASVRSQFKSSLKRLRSTRKGIELQVADPTQPSSSYSSSEDLSQYFPHDVPLIGIGHSMGSLLHLLIGSTQGDNTRDSERVDEDLMRCNILLSFNNKQVSDAIPIPGLLGALKPAVGLGNQVLSSLPPSLSSQLTATKLLGSALGFIPGPLRSILDQDGRVSRSALALDQLNQVAQEVGSGAVDFKPSPSETRGIIKQGYLCPRTLLIRFSDDSIDESLEAESLLRSNMSYKSSNSQSQSASSSSSSPPSFIASSSSSSLVIGRERLPRGGDSNSNSNARSVALLTLPGSHLTPCGGDLNLKRTLADVLGEIEGMTGDDDPRRAALEGLGMVDEVLRLQSQSDIRRMSSKVIEWLEHQG